MQRNRSIGDRGAALIEDRTAYLGSLIPWAAVVFNMRLDSAAPACWIANESSGAGSDIGE